MSFPVFSFASLPLRRVVGVLVLLAGGLVGNSVSATQISLTTPAGLNPGDTFRFLFLTQGTTTATSTDIATYNSFVNSQAGGATYGGTTVAWNAIGSTATVNARDNVGGFGSSEPVYLVDGTLFANDLTTTAVDNGLWSGAVLAKPNIGIDGSNLGAVYSWTGSSADGLKNASPLGANYPMAGYTDFQISFWLQMIGNPKSSSMQMYGVSSQLTVPSAVPEIDPAGMGSVLALVTGALGLLERRRLRAKAAA